MIWKGIGVGGGVDIKTAFEYSWYGIKILAVHNYPGKEHRLRCVEYCSKPRKSRDERAVYKYSF